MNPVINASEPIWAVGSAFLTALLIALTGRWQNLRDLWGPLGALAQFGIVASLVPAVLSGETRTFTLTTPMPGVALYFKVDELGLFFALMASFLWFIASLYSVGYMRALKEHAQTRFFAFYAISLGSAVGIAFAGNLFTLFVFYEMLTLATYPLVVHKQDAEARAKARVYMTYLLGTSIGFQFTAILVIYGISGELNFTKGGFLQGQAPDWLLLSAFLLYIAGIGKSAIMPFHKWLPSAMVAPAPVSALLHAVAVVKAGVFTVLRVVVYVFGVDCLVSLQVAQILPYVAGTTIVVASLIALFQDDLKLRLAYSTISQLSYVVLGAGLLSPLGAMGATLHMVFHGFAKITLFFTAGHIYCATKKTKISQMRGIGKQMPFTMIGFTIGALGMIGLPPASSLWSKWYIGLGALETQHYFALGVLVVSTILNALYFLPIVYSAFFEGGGGVEALTLPSPPSPNTVGEGESQLLPSPDAAGEGSVNLTPPAPLSASREGGEALYSPSPFTERGQGGEVNPETPSPTLPLSAGGESQLLPSSEASGEGQGVRATEKPPTSEVIEFSTPYLTLMTLAICATALGVLVLFVYPHPFLELARRVAGL